MHYRILSVLAFLLLQLPAISQGRYEIKEGDQLEAFEVTEVARTL
jgi:hypothetical protein